MILQIFTNFHHLFKAGQEWAVRAISYQRIQMLRHLLTQHASPDQTSFKTKKKSSSYKQNNKGEITPPCFTLFETGKLADFATPQST